LQLSCTLHVCNVARLTGVVRQHNIFWGHNLKGADDFHRRPEAVSPSGSRWSDRALVAVLDN
jgi:hypothetical protein